MAEEAKIEDYLRLQVKKIGGWALKFVCPGIDGAPDRLILWNGRLWFVEVKARKKVPRTLQLWFHRKLARLGFIVLVLDTKIKIDEFIHSIQLSN